MDAGKIFRHKDCNNLLVSLTIAELPVRNDSAVDKLASSYQVRVINDIQLSLRSSFWVFRIFATRRLRCDFDQGFVTV